MYTKALIFFIINFCMGCQSNSQEFTLYQKGKIIPEVFVVNKAYQNAAEDFCNLFEKATGQRPKIVSELSVTKVQIIIGELDEKLPNGGFRIQQQGNAFSIKGTGGGSALFGVRYFFAVYSNSNQFDNETKQKLEILKVPMGLNYTKEYAFEYREPYFPDNQHTESRLWNSTNTIDDTWGLWGHNIHKFISVTDKMMAVVDGKSSDEQYCFSSPEFEHALVLAVENSGRENGNAFKFMVMPNDNFMVCQCKRCKAMGNTKSNASPAVFTLLNKLAQRFPKQQFFSAAYNTTIVPPSFKLATNAGVMISTMPFPKGVVIEQSNKKAIVEKSLQDWKKITDKMYLWDYAVNFDNYFEFYPTVSIAQKNLKFYKKQGITGVFINGNEGSYAAFDNLKFYLYAQLLSDPDIDLDKHIHLFFDKKYPDVSYLLLDYYSKIEKYAFNSRNQLEIYGGLQQAKDKYLKEADFDFFYNQFIGRYEQLSSDKSTDLAPLVTALTFLKLEMRRTNGIGENGYAHFEKDKTVAVVSPEIPLLLARLRKLSKETTIDVYNESGALISDYLASWENEINNKKYKNLFYGKNFRVLSVLDDEYQNKHMLNDGAIGFNDYYNNWLLSTKDALQLEIAAEDVKGATTVSLTFLSNTKHKIYLPKEVVVTIGDRKFKAQIDSKPDTTKHKYEVKIPIIINTKDQLINISIIKQDNYKKKSIACDEILFN
ncbi:DUF4838 domain-containing protein [Flavobacterium cerinum]|uniref:DUF4838 domain-containing protein n=1 Tax=Flavobacterium cerinum TaxID=2502784 RepID=A0A444GL85_9FLAO|nr:DUF4838 domain-containing protein [Flavobacterium cerinum]RWW91764.1 DUF4838 domain-containing protein [Flavobacterium cerinum]